ncbi:DNA polymerase III subunit gamma/tau [Tepidibacillus decaturensis]|uniref:DNA-directed DNA polymerase n=1 Tax=Tepidibacillus decaturensis TaxID=1413211 RepID=A0A135L795_9BACI|nr:DNA polymerase III subunit gamma/tau [Tepidibacillus decaturensis]KXG44809.1 DNA polymerase III subunit gamma/tau [Tepidibacillus decaturensis]
MAYLALYRAWRPQTFEDVIGQEHITQTLQNALRENRFSHAYLFSGPRGTGKTSTAKIFAKAVNCELGPREEPCNQCKTCIGITKGFNMDVVEIDAASNRGVEEIRDLREKVKFAPTEARYKVYIIDEVHMLTTEAFNALLKTLEEPPSHVIFILATTEPHKLPLTIISRCQRFDYRRVSVEAMVTRLSYISDEKGYQITKEALSLIALQSEGGMRDALSLLDQVLAFSGDEITVEDVLRVTGRVSYQEFSRLATSILKRETTNVLQQVSQLLQEGKDPEKLLEDLLFYYRDLLLYKSAPSLEQIKEKPLIDDQFPQVANSYSNEQLFQTIETLNQYLNEMKWTNQSQIILELALVKVSTSHQNQDGQLNSKELDELKSKIKELESKLEHIHQAEAIETVKVDHRPITPSQHHPTNGQVVKRLLQWKSSFSEERYQKLLQVWPKILQTVKQRKITVHAWLVDGEPVAISSDTIVISFKNMMHRDTTDKPSHRQLIEQIILDVFGQPFHIYNIMQKDWQRFLEENQDEGTQSLQEEQGDSDEDDEIVKKAIELFGEDLIVIKD